jgi:hypothetical protein
MAFAIKADIRDALAETFVFPNHKSMYGGRKIAAGDVVFLFASETQGGHGLIARGVVNAAEPTPPIPDVDRQTPRVSVTVRRTAVVRRPLGRGDLKGFKAWSDGRPETELNFKFYRQSTNKIIGVSDQTAAFLEGFF